MNGKDAQSFNRRNFLGVLAAAGAGIALSPSLARGQYANFDKPVVPPRPTFFFAQMMYGQGMQWNPNPTAARSLMQVLTRRTSVEASLDRMDLAISNERFFLNPFIYMTGTREFEPLAPEDIDKLRRFLNFGGFMLVDDALGETGFGFDKSFQREFSRLFPGEALVKLPEDHTVYQSYYLIDRVAGRKINRPYLMGLDRGERTVLMYSSNDLGGAWARDMLGKWVNECTPGGDRQREAAIRLGINIILYALTVDYKKDLIHVPFISERRRGKQK